MTPPRYIKPGQIHFFTRRTHHRRFRLRPCTFTKQLFEYLLAVGAEHYDLGILGYSSPGFARSGRSSDSLISRLWERAPLRVNQVSAR